MFASPSADVDSGLFTNRDAKPAFQLRRRRIKSAAGTVLGGRALL